jgi:hypothetical protein
VTDLEIATDLASRVSRIDWDAFIGERVRSGFLLMKEYLRRGALWARQLDATGRWPYFDVASLVSPALQVSPEAEARLDEAMTGAVPVPLMKDTLHWALRFEVLRQTGVELPLPDPYEPLLWMYDRGGSFVPEKGFINIDAHLMPRGAYTDYLTAEPFARLDTDWLDARDAGVR